LAAGSLSINLKNAGDVDGKSSESGPSNGSEKHQNSRSKS